MFKINMKGPRGKSVEDWFIECYKKNEGHPMKILLGLYRGNYNTQPGMGASNHYGQYH